MMSKILKIAIIALFVLFPIYSVSAVNSLDVVINEIAWMGTEVGWRDEWIELRNMTDQDIDLSSWVIENASKNHGSLEIPQDGKHTIPSNGYYLISYYSKADNLLEPKAALNVIVDWRVKNMGDISLANNYKDNGQLRLRDSYGTLIDQTPSPTDNNWPAGDNKTKQTMERTISGNWQNSQEPNGTPKAINGKPIEIKPLPAEKTQVPELIEPEFKQITIEPEKPIEDGPLYVYIEGVVFNEILPSPDGPDAENEWIEIYNQNNSEVDLSGCIIQDTAGSTKIYTLNTKIPAYGYLVFLRPETKITLNNDGDGLTFLSPNREIIDSITFGKASLDQSYNRTESGWTWTTNLTPGEKNIIPQESRSAFAKTSADEAKKDEDGPRIISDFDNIVDINLASQKSNFNIFLIAFIVALFCSIAFLIIKNNLKSFWD